ncbi:hypothetical protein HDU97_002846 [Phlyctochytrium planicorne]|nr:hypothetical protein HDU97_002846 [Phlyctochytrium planicorne]
MHSSHTLRWLTILTITLTLVQSYSVHRPRDPDLYDSDNDPDDATTYRRIQNPKPFSIPKGYTGDFDRLFKDFRIPAANEFEIIKKDDGAYNGDHVIPYITSPSHMTFGRPAKRFRRSQTFGQDKEAEPITIFTQTSLDRVMLLPDLVDRWDGYVSCSIYIENYEELPSLGKALRMLEERFMELETGKYVSVSLLFGLEFLISLGFEYNQKSGERQSLDIPTVDMHPEMVEEGVKDHHEVLKRIKDGMQGKQQRQRRQNWDHERQQQPMQIGRRVFQPYDFLFPINSLRNLALSQAQTPLVLYMDIDFLISEDAHAILTSSPYIQILSNRTASIIAIPAFEITETTHMKSPKLPPLTMKFLKKGCMQNQIIPFHSKPIPDLPFLPSPDLLRPFCSGESPSPPHLKITQIQAASNYASFFSPSTPSPYLANLAVNMGKKHPIDRRYEPYVLAHKSALPEFDETFRGYGFNKRVHSILLQAMGTKFYVAKGVYVLHKPHPPSESKLKLHGSFRATVGRAYNRFLKDIRSKYFDKNRLRGIPE